MSWGKVRASVQPQIPTPPPPPARTGRSGRSRAAGWTLLCLLAGLLLRIPPPGCPGPAAPGESRLLTLDGYFYARQSERSDARSFPLRDVLDAPAQDRHGSALPVLARIPGAILPRAWFPALAGALVAVLLMPAARRRWPDLPPPLLTAALLAGCASPYFTARTTCGWFDTDGLLVLSLTLLLSSVELLRPDRIRAAAAALLTGTFLLAWTWDQAPDVVVLIAAFHLALFARAGRRHPSTWPVVAAGAAGVLLLLGVRAVLAAPWHWLGRLDYLRKNNLLAYPNPSGMVEEQLSSGWREALLAASGGWPAAALILAGLVLLGRRAGPATVAALAPCLLLGWGAAIAAPRFAVFAAPVAALGFAALAACILERARRPRAAVWLIAAALTGWTGWQGVVARHLAGSAVDPLERRISDALLTARSLPRPQTPPVAWAWWDEGYEIQYRLGWRTLVDGGHHDGEHCAIAATPLAMTRQDAAARYIRRIARGGIRAARDREVGRSLQPDGSRAIEQRVLTLPPDPPGGPVYLVLTSRTAMAFPHVLFCGTWNPARRDGVRAFYEFHPVITETGGILRSESGMTVQVAGWRPEAAGRFIVLPAPAMTAPPPGYPAQTGRLEVHLGQGHGALAAPRALDTVFHQLFVRRQPDPACLRALPGATPDLVIYQVLAPGES